MGDALVRLQTSPPNHAAASGLAGAAITGVVTDVDGRRAVAITAAGEALSVEVDQLGGGQRLGSIGQPVTALQVTHDGTIAAAGVGHVTLIDVETGKHTVIGAPGNPVTALAADRTGLLVTGGRDVFEGGGGPLGADALIDLAAGETFFEHTVAGSAVTGVAVHPAGHVVAIGNDRGEVQLREARSDRRIADLRLAPAVADLAFTSSGDELVGLATDGTIVRWTADGRTVGSPIELDAPANDLALAPDDRARRRHGERRGRRRPRDR